MPDRGRCEVCDWPLAESVAKGCVPGNCSYRPHGGTAEYYRIQRRRDELAKRAEVQRPCDTEAPDA